MGVYDTVLVKCPSCGAEMQFQTKSGPCTLGEYLLHTAPEDVMNDVNRHSPMECHGCNRFWEIKRKYAIVETVGPRYD